MSKYRLYQTGPDNRSTYAECWGANPASKGTLIREAGHLADFLEIILGRNGLGHDNWWIEGPDGGRVASSRREYRELPEVLEIAKQVYGD